MQEMQETQVQSLGLEDPMEKKMVTHSSTLAWEFPWREDPGGLQSIGSDMTEPLSMHAQSQVWGGSLEADVPACMLRERHLLIWKEQLLAPQKKLVKK